MIEEQKWLIYLKKVEALEMKKMKQVSVVTSTDQICEICVLSGHPAVECPTILAFKEVLIE